MLVYVAFYFLSAIFALLATLFDSKKWLKIAFILLDFILFFLLLSFRADSVGNDIFAYAKQYNTISSLSLSQTLKLGSEKGYLLLNKIFTIATIPWPVFLSFVSLISLVGIFAFGYYCSKNWFLYYIFYLAIGPFAMTFSGLRQSVAISIFLVALIFLIKDFPKIKKPIKYVIYYLLILVGVTFHSSLIVAVFVPFLLLIKKHYVAIFIVLILSLLVWIGGPQLYSMVWRYLSSNYGPFDNSSFSAFAIIFSAITLLLLFYGDFFKKHNLFCRYNIREYISNFNLFETCENGIDSASQLAFFSFISVLFMATVSANSTTPRMHFYFDIFTILLVSNMKFPEKKKNRIILFTLVTIFGVTMFVYKFLYQNPMEVIPYVFR